MVEQTVGTPVIWDAISLIMASLFWIMHIMVHKHTCIKLIICIKPLISIKCLITIILKYTFLKFTTKSNVQNVLISMLKTERWNPSLTNCTNYDHSSDKHAYYQRKSITHTHIYIWLTIQFHKKWCSNLHTLQLHFWVINSGHWLNYASSDTTLVGKISIAVWLLLYPYRVLYNSRFCIR